MSEDLVLRCIVDGAMREADIEPQSVLVETLRDAFDATGTHIGCLTGDCGACTVRLDGRLVKSCLVLSASCQGRAITTIEDGDDPLLNVLRRAFVSEHGFQCGFCTAGMILAAAELLRNEPDPADERIRAGVAGNLCRCTGYDGIVDAVREAGETARREGLLP